MPAFPSCIMELSILVQFTSKCLISVFCFIPTVTNMIHVIITTCPNCWNIVLNCLHLQSIPLHFTLHIHYKIFSLKHTSHHISLLLRSFWWYLIACIFIYLINFYWTFMFLTLFQFLRIWQSTKISVLLSLHSSVGQVYMRK